MADGVYSYPQGGAAAYPGPREEILPATLKRISWGSIFAGVAVALVVQLLFALLGLSIGLGTVNPTQETDPFAGLTIGAAIWWIVSGLISLFLGGWVAGRLAGIPRRFEGALHGVLVWALTAIISILFLGTVVGSLIGGALNILRGGMAMAGQAVGAAMPEGGRNGGGFAAFTDSIRLEAREMLRQTEEPALHPDTLRQRLGNVAQDAAEAAMAAARDPESAGRILDSLLQGMLAEGREVARDVDRDAAVNLLVARTDMPRAQAEQTVDNWIQAGRQASARADTALEEARQKAAEIGESVASGVAQASFWSFLVILLGGVSGGLGGMTGAPRDVQRFTPGTPPADRKT